MTILACSLLLVAGCRSKRSIIVESFDEPPRPSSPPEEVRAVSLKVLQAGLRTCQPENSCPPELLRLAGLNTILGFVVDQTNQDLILFGQSDSSLPALYLEDFVIALRNAEMKYAPLEGNIYHYSYPGCSIDPVPEVMRQLQLIEQQLATRRSLDELERALDNWRFTCQKPQAVRVLGIPFDTHFAQVMVKADYEMKTLADGADAIGIPGFISMTEMSLGEARRDILQKQSVTLSASLNRFWFYPGETVCEEDQDVLFIKQSPIRLLTEEMYSNARGQTIQSGLANPKAARFAENFTALYSRVKRQRPIYQELENLFRFVALAKLIEKRKAATFDLTFLLDDFVVASAPVSRSLPGRHTVKNLEHREENQHAIRVMRLWFPSCGGVTIELTPKIEPDSTGQLGKLGTVAKESRPSPNALSWKFEDSAYALSEKKENARLQAINQFNKTNRVFTVIYKPEAYLIYDGDSEPLLFGIDLFDFYNRIQTKYGDSSIEIFWIKFKDFPNRDKEQAFFKTLSLRNLESNNQREFKLLPDRRNSTTDSQDLLFLPGVSINQKDIKIESVTEGEHKGLFKIILNCLVQVEKKIYRVVIIVFVNSRELAQAFLVEVIAYFTAPDFKAESLIDSLNEIERIFKRKYPEAEIEIEFEGIQISQLVPAAEQGVTT